MIRRNHNKTPETERQDDMKLRSIRTLLVLALILAISSAFIPAAGADTKYRRTLESYSMPDVVLVDQNGTKVRFKELMLSNKPIVVDFIFGTCTTICPILSAGYANLQQKLGQDAQNVHLVSISIDPENDTPKVMTDYLKRYRAKTGWDFLTGSRADIDKVMYAFNAYIPNKMSHYPLTLIRTPADGKWVRVFGLLSSSEFIDETRKAGIK
jgi:protein SCO1/2